jgi:hypothetical protein
MLLFPFAGILCRDDFCKGCYIFCSRLFLHWTVLFLLFMFHFLLFSFPLPRFLSRSRCSVFVSFAYFCSRCQISF